MKLLYAILHFLTFLKKVYYISPCDEIISIIRNKDYYYLFLSLTLSEILTVLETELIPKIDRFMLSVTKARAFTILLNLLLEYF